MLVPPRLVRFGTRLLIYVGVWLLVALAFEILLEPAGITETDLSPARQRMMVPLETPILVAFGLAQSMSWPASPNDIAAVAAITILIMHGFFTLAGAHRKLFLILIYLQVALSAVAVIYIVRLSHLPSGP